MHGRAAEPGGHEQGADLVAVQADRVGLVIQPRTAHVRRRGVLERVLAKRRPSDEPIAAASAESHAPVRREMPAATASLSCT